MRATQPQANYPLRQSTPQLLGLLERFHETLEEEEAYCHLTSSPNDGREGLEAFRDRDHSTRPRRTHIPASGGDVATPANLCCPGIDIQLPTWQG